MSSKKKKTTLEVRIRHTQRAGYETIFVKAAGLTLTGAKDANILLFLVCPDKTLKKVETNRDIVLEKGTKYVALEYFTVVPVDLFRTVANGDLQHVTLAHPNHGTSRFTKTAPLYCAGFDRSKDEDMVPWYGMKLDGKTLRVHGVSLRCRDYEEQTVEGNLNPFTEPYEHETKAKALNMTLDAAFGDLEVSGHGGILLSDATHDSRVKAKKHEYKYDNKTERKKNDLPTSRSTYFRFKLKKDIDLAPYGVAVVYDNSSELHFSLVPVDENSWDACNRAFLIGMFATLYLPLYAWDTYRFDMNYDKLSELARDVLATTDNEPLSSVNGSMTHLPEVASLFSLHDVKLVAQAEPRHLDPSDEYYDVYKAALVLYHLNLGWDVYLAIVSLEEANYVIADLGQSARDSLQDAVLEALDDCKLAVDELEWDDQRAQDALDAMLAALSQHDISASEHGSPSRAKPIVLDLFTQKGHAKKANDSPGSSSGDSTTKL